MKVAGWDCDMRCSYCYYYSPSRKNSGILMPLNVVDRVCAIQVASTDTQDTTMIWHGGEPTIPGTEYYKEILTIQQKHQASSGIRILNKIQTNGLNLTNEWIEFFLSNDITPGVSIDGPSAIHNAYRVDLNGNGTHKRILQNIRSAHESGLKLGCIAVLTDKSVGKAQEMFEFFVESELKGFKVKPCYEIDPSTGKVLPFSISPKDYGEFLIKLFNIWVEHDDPRITIGPLDDILRGLSGKLAKQCVFKRNCAQFWSIWPDGSAYQCEYNCVDTAYIGNVTKDNLDVLHARHAASPILQSIATPNVGCSNCEWNNFCKGGCSRYDVGLGRITNLYCLSSQMLFSHVAEYLEI